MSWLKPEWPLARKGSKRYLASNLKSLRHPPDPSGGLFTYSRTLKQFTVLHTSSPLCHFTPWLKMLSKWKFLHLGTSCFCAIVLSMPLMAKSLTTQCMFLALTKVFSLFLSLIFSHFSVFMVHSVSIVLLDNNTFNCTLVLTQWLNKIDEGLCKPNA